MSDLNDLLGIDHNDPLQAHAAQLVANDSKLLRDLVAYRQAAGLAVETVAERMNIPAGSVRALERPTADPLLSTLRRYALAIGAVVEHHVSPVSSQDTPAPLPVEPRVLRDPQMYRDGDPWRWFEAHPGLFTYAPDWATACAFADPPYEGICRNYTLEHLRAKYGELTDVTADHPATEALSESPATQGGER